MAIDAINLNKYSKATLIRYMQEVLRPLDIDPGRLDEIEITTAMEAIEDKIKTLRDRQATQPGLHGSLQNKIDILRKRKDLLYQELMKATGVT